MGHQCALGVKGLKCDVLLFSDVFEKIRDNSLKYYVLCLSHYLSSPVWDAMLKVTKIKLEFIADPDMYMFFEKGTRGGNSYISNRYSKANNKYFKYPMIQNKNQNMLYTQTRIICIVM